MGDMAGECARTWDGPARAGWRVTVSGLEAASGAGAPSFDGLDDHGLVTACLEGHDAAFDVLVRRHQRAIYRLCYRFVGNHEDASDLSQDVFLRAYRGLKGFRRRSSVSTWLYRIAVNVSLSRVGAKSLATEPLAGEPRIEAPAEDGPVQELLRAERAARVRNAIGRLPPRQRATLVLRVYHELPHQQIAQIFGSSVGAVKANFFHALHNLKKLLGTELL
jgi:RNA polymerase sigma-70 factor, ECF subfamily